MAQSANAMVGKGWSDLREVHDDLQRRSREAAESARKMMVELGARIEADRRRANRNAARRKVALARVRGA